MFPVIVMTSSQLLIRCIHSNWFTPCKRRTGVVAGVWIQNNGNSSSNSFITKRVKRHFGIFQSKATIVWYKIMLFEWYLPHFKSISKVSTIFSLFCFIFQQLQSQISHIDQNGYNPFCDETFQFQVGGFDYKTITLPYPNINKHRMFTACLSRCEKYYITGRVG